MSKKFNIVFCMLMLSLAAACSKKKATTSSTAKAPVATVNPAPLPVNPGPSDTVKRYCATPIAISGGSSGAAATLADFFQNPVSGLEGDATICLKISGYGTFLKNAAVRLEYEDHHGVSALEFNKTSEVFYAEVKQTSSVTTFEVIFMDSVGFLQIKGSGSTNATMTIKYHNFPSMQDYLLTSLTEIQTKCKNGTYTVAQCLGYNWPSTHWWNQPVQGSPEQQQLALARGILSNTSKTKLLGTASMNLTNFINR